MSEHLSEQAAEYVPTTAEVKDAASIDGATAIEGDAFDRWLAAHVADAVCDVQDHELNRLRAVLGAVAALADEWASHVDGSSYEDWNGRWVVTVDLAVTKLRAVLAPVSGAVEACSTCGGAGVLPWMSEADPNSYQEVDDDGNVPCPDCRVSGAVAEPDDVEQRVEVVEALQRLGDGALAWAGNKDAVHEDVGIVRTALDAAPAAKHEQEVVEKPCGRDWTHGAHYHWGAVVDFRHPVSPTLRCSGRADALTEGRK
jgi:hypothetical protein